MLKFCKWYTDMVHYPDTQDFRGVSYNAGVQSPLSSQSLILHQSKSSRFLTFPCQIIRNQIYPFYINFYSKSMSKVSNWYVKSLKNMALQNQPITGIKKTSGYSQQKTIANDCVSNGF